MSISEAIPPRELGQLPAWFGLLKVIDENEFLAKPSLKVSIITVCYNSVNTIRDTIESVIAQEYGGVEYIIVDGGSNDGTLDVIQEYSNSINIVISEPDQGIYDAFNKGVRHASGDVVGILNSDDVYAENSVISELIDCMIKKNTDTVFADLVIVDANNSNRVMRYYDSSSFAVDRLRYGWMPAHPTFMVKRKLYEENGLFSLDYSIAADFEMVVRLLYTASATYCYLPIVAVKMRTGGISNSGVKNSWLLNKEIVKACRKHGIKTSLPRVLLKTPKKILEYFYRPGRVDRN